MAIENLPRPWVLAALTGLKMSELAALPADERPEALAQPATRLPPRRRRLRDATKDCRPGTVVEVRFG